MGQHQWTNIRVTGVLGKKKSEGQWRTENFEEIVGRNICDICVLYVNYT